MLYEDTMLTIAEAVEAAGYASNSTLYTAIARGDLPAFRRGNRLWEIRKTDLLDYIASRSRRGSKRGGTRRTRSRQEEVPA